MQLGIEEHGSHQRVAGGRVSGQFPGQRVRLGFVDDQLQYGGGIEVNDHRSPRRSRSRSSLLTSDRVRSNWVKSTGPVAAAWRTAPASSSRSNGDDDGGISVAATSPLLVTSIVSPFFTRSRILLLSLRSWRW